MRTGLILRVLNRIGDNLWRAVSRKRGESAIGSRPRVSHKCKGFGFEKKNPILVFFPEGESAYLSRLRCPCGEAFLFHRVGSCGTCPDGHVVDLFELNCLTGTHRYFLYLDMYHPVGSEEAPEGLSLSDPTDVEFPFTSISGTD